MAAWSSVIQARFADPMRAVVQRVTRAQVRVAGQVIGDLPGGGLLIFLAVAPGDTPETGEWMARKLAGLRIFSDEEGRMNRSVVDEGLGALVISQFTLYGDCRKGRRPSFLRAAPPEMADELYRLFCDQLGAEDVHPVPRGQFAADMDVDLLNDGPVTLIVDSP
jgi:D-tyrosyl-tRNA(Tyr) deacylase